MSPKPIWISYQILLLISQNSINVIYAERFDGIRLFFKGNGIYSKYLFVNLFLFITILQNLFKKYLEL